jgi:nucleotide-binding universal stress UspA family protein
VVHARPGHVPGPVDITDRVAHVANRHPEVAVTPTAVEGPPTRYLLEASRSAAMLVVGGRGRGAAAGALLGSTSQALIRGSECPVAVVRDQVVLDQLASRRHSLCS